MVALCSPTKQEPEDVEEEYVVVPNGCTMLSYRAQGFI